MWEVIEEVNTITGERRYGIVYPTDDGPVDATAVGRYGTTYIPRWTFRWFAQREADRRNRSASWEAS